jgi:alkyl hydroperoxide reductase subunit AhpC
LNLVVNPLIYSQITVNDLPVGRSVDETIRLIQAFQFTVRYLLRESVAPTHAVIQDLHGEVCPANWTKGSKTMKADPTGSLEYFSTVDSGHTNGTKRSGDAMAVDEAKKVKV